MSKKKEQEKAKKQRQWEREDATIKDFRVKAPHMKRFMKAKGCDLPFYDFLDSYSAEFNRIAAQAKKDCPSLTGIHEVDEETYRNSDWTALGCGEYTHVLFNIGEEIVDYGSPIKDANLCGATAAFKDSDNRLRTCILIRRTCKTLFEHAELKYAVKVVALLHEIGHVHDMERGVNFDVDARRANIIEAEAYAHLFALNGLAQRQMRQSYDILLDALQAAVGKGGYLDAVATLVVERLPAHPLVNWQNVFAANPITEADLAILGREGLKAFGVKA